VERLGDGAPPRVNDDGSNGTMSEAAVIDDDGGGDPRLAPVKKRMCSPCS
jgi:hypothetical protein